MYKIHPSLIRGHVFEFWKKKSKFGMLSPLMSLKLCEFELIGTQKDGQKPKQNKKEMITIYIYFCHFLHFPLFMFLFGCFFLSLSKLSLGSCWGKLRKSNVRVKQITHACKLESQILTNPSSIIGAVLYIVTIYRRISAIILKVKFTCNQLSHFKWKYHANEK